MTHQAANATLRSFCANKHLAATPLVCAELRKYIGKTPAAAVAALRSRVVPRARGARVERRRAATRDARRFERETNRRTRAWRDGRTFSARLSHHHAPAARLSAPLTSPPLSPASPRACLSLQLSFSDIGMPPARFSACCHGHLSSLVY